jgi:hypothetical protein
MTGSKRVDHWASGTVYECGEIADTPQGSPPAADYVSCQAGGGPAASVKPGQKSYVRSSGIITLSAQGPSDGSGRSPPQKRPPWSITLGSPISPDNANRRIPVSHKYPPWGLNLGPSYWEANGWTTGPVELCMNAVRLPALDNVFFALKWLHSSRSFLRNIKLIWLKKYKNFASPIFFLWNMNFRSADLNA